MATFSKEELAKIRDKEQANRDRAIAASAVHDAAVMDSIKSKLGMGQAPQQAPAPAPAPAQTPQMKKGGFVEHSKHVKKHAAGFKHHDDHVKSMCKGGKS
jgi:hypothetical protein